MVNPSNIIVISSRTDLLCVPLSFLLLLSLSSSLFPATNFLPIGTAYSQSEIPDVDRVLKEAESFFSQKNYTQAMALYDKVLAIEPDNFFGLTNKGVILFNLGQYEEAIKLYDRILQIDPNDVLALQSHLVFFQSCHSISQQESTTFMFGWFYC